MAETDKKKLRDINSPVYEYFNNGIGGIRYFFEKLQTLLDESSKNEISQIKEYLDQLTYTKKGVMDLHSRRNIKRIIEVNTIFRELLLKEKLYSEDFITRWYELIEMYYYSHAVLVKEKCIQYKDNNNDEVKEKRALYIETTKLFIDLHLSLENINIFGFEIGYRSMFICDELRELCKDL
jgi:hypothetical protein